MPTVKISLKKSESTNKVIAVINGRVKVGEYVDGKVIPTGEPSRGILNRIEHLNSINGWGEQKPQSIRFTDDLKKKIQDQATKENRSFSNMIVTMANAYLANK